MLTAAFAGWDRRTTVYGFCGGKEWLPSGNVCAC